MPASGDSNLTVGAKVTLHSLVSAAQHNGAYGILKEYFPDSGRWEVQLWASIDGLRVKPANIQKLSAKEWDAAAKEGAGRVTGPWHGSTAEQLMQQLRPLSSSGQETCLHEREGRLVYALFGCLGAMALPKLNAQRQENKLELLKFDPIDSQANDMKTRAIVLEFVLANIEEFAGRFCAEPLPEEDRRLISSALGRRATNTDKQAVRSWKNHVSGDFWVVGATSDGVVCVQLGEPRGPDTMAMVQPWTPECRSVVFVIKGLADPLSRMLAPLEASLKQKGGPGYPVLAMTILPSPDGAHLTYASTVTMSESLPRSTPKQIAEAKERAGTAYARAVRERKVFRKLADADTDVIRPAWYKIDWKLETSICKHGQEKENCDVCGGGGAERSGRTMLRLGIIAWTPLTNPSDPRNREGIIRALSERPSWSAGGGCQGFKNNAQLDIGVEDGDTCQLCAEPGKRFGVDCACKQQHLQRVERAIRHQSGKLATYFYDPPDRVLGEQMRRLANSAGDRGFDAFKMLPIGLADESEIAITLPAAQELETVRARLHDSGLFHATSNETWDYLSYFAFPTPQGIVTYGNVQLDESARTVTAMGLTARRTAAIAEELAHMTCDLNISAPKVTAKPARKARPDTGLLERASALLQRPGVEASGVEVQKRGEHTAKKCDYCGAVERGQQPHAKCSGCKMAWYCSSECQNKHWKAHKKKCRAKQSE